MSRRDRQQAHPRVSDELERRWLLTAPQIPGNVGQVVLSQFQPFGFKTTVGTQLRDVTLRGPFKIDVVTPLASTATGQASASPPINSGLIAHSQFNGGGFRTVGLQLDRVDLGRGLTVSGFDNEDPGAGGGGGTLPLLVNSNLINNSQFSDGGFGVLEFNAAGKVIAREGRVGLQWRNVRVRGPVNVGLDDVIIRPGATTSTPAASTAVSTPGKTVLDLTTNTGRVQNSQFNDGGFGDIGMQWSKVGVGGRVGTSTNTLFINPLQNNYGPITVKNQVFGQSTTSASALASTSAPADNSAARPSRAVPRASVQDQPFLTTYTNSATNSGRIVGAQVNDGGFGDIGMQWQNVRVGGNVTAVHNSLTVQPKNVGQGLITVQGVQFPTTAPAPPRQAPEPRHVLPADPPVVANDGNPVAATLPAPTGPLSPFFPTPLSGPGTVTLPYPGNYPLVNAASNSGLVLGGQFNAGGFGDQGLQWQNVRVGGNVQVVHNSLSVHPEGSKLAGISVSDVSYGPPVSPRVARHLAVLPYLVVSPGTSSAATSASIGGGHVFSPPNDRVLTNQQLAPATGTNVFLQWNGIEHKRGLVIVHNIIQITGVGPTTGPITLTNIRFPFRIPPTAPLKVTTVSPAQPATAVPQAISASTLSRAAFASVVPREAVLRNAANNSGILFRSQFSDGGFGDDGLQWRNVSVGGSVTLVHNTLAVDTTSDTLPGDVSGPIAISNITFNSGALNTGLSPAHNQVLVSPPDVFQRVSSHPLSLGRPLPQNPAVRNDAANSGIMLGGQLAAGAANHVLLQWQCVKVPGKVTVVDNVLSISVLDKPSGPITISNVTFA
ncbi:MAG: hypothetical protein P4L84_13115 [Isosphaeraceae bacterium]|nr:hypothetical protein [Isosphaeraceae bacterium]